MPTITVTSLANNGAGTFRQAIISAAANDTINFAVTGEIVLTSGQLTIGKNLTITAPGIDQLIVSSNGTGRVMQITTGVVHMTGLYMRHGVAATGGGLVNSGTTTMTDCKVSNNTATGKGGGIWNEGTLTLNNVLVQSNESSDHGAGIYNSGTLTLGSLAYLTSNITHGSNHDGGGIYNDFGTVTSTEATLDGNTATRNGGAFYNSGTFYLLRSTASVNQSASGAIYNYLGTIYHRNSTISDNVGGVGTNDLGSVYFVQCTVVGNGDGWNNGTGTTEVGNSIFVDNGSTDLYGLDPATSNGHNIIGTFNDNFTPDGSDITGTSLADLKIGDLDDNGGPTLTRKLLTNSPAIDAGDNALPPYATDQRGTGFARILNSTVDIGAYESEVVVPPPPPPPPPPITNPGEVCVAEGTFREVLYDPTPAQIVAVQAALNAKAVAYAQELAFTQCPTPVNPCPCLAAMGGLGFVQPATHFVSELTWYDGALLQPVTDPSISGSNGENINQMAGADGWYDTTGSTGGGDMSILSDILCMQPGQTLTVTLTVVRTGDPNFLYFGTVQYGTETKGLDIDNPTTIAGEYSYSFPVSVCTQSQIQILSGARNAYVTVHVALS